MAKIVSFPRPEGVCRVQATCPCFTPCAWMAKAIPRPAMLELQEREIVDEATDQRVARRAAPKRRQPEPGLKVDGNVYWLNNHHQGRP